MSYPTIQIKQAEYLYSKIIDDSINQGDLTNFVTHKEGADYHHEEDELSKLLKTYLKNTERNPLDLEEDSIRMHR